ncbi:MAG: YbaN family protein [Candidatus Hermodarchaeota archaeon]
MSNDKQPERKSDFDEKLLAGSRLKRALYFIAGTLCLILGIIGIILPILPTTPFLLLTVACYLRSSERFYNWLLNSKILGSYIRNYKEGKGMPTKIKAFTISILWITILISFFLIPIIWVRCILIIIAIAVTIHIILIKPKKSEE